jgi:hypothetical protein
MRASTLNRELLVATITDFDGENARPTMAGPDRNKFRLRSGEILTTPRRPPSDAATYRFPEHRTPCPADAQPAIERFHLSVPGDAVDRIEAGRGGAGDVQISVRSESQVVGGDGRFERGEHVNLPLPADLENGAAAVADEKIVVAIESDPGGHAHAFHVGRRVTDGDT